MNQREGTLAGATVTAMRDRRIGLAFTAAVTVALSPTVAGAATLPPAVGESPVTDGVRKIALIANNTVVGYDTSSRSAIGVPVQLPPYGAGFGYSLHAIGIVDSRVLLSGVDLAETTAELGSTVLAIGDLQTGQLRWLCGGPRASGTPEVFCPGVGRPYENGPLQSRMSFGPAGSRWIRASGFVAVRWSVDGAGVLSWRAATRDERSAIRRIGYDSFDLDSKRIRTNDRFGYTWRHNDSDNELRIRRDGDRRSGVLRRLRAVNSVGPEVSYASLGICARVGSTLYLWDKRSRRVWRRSLKGPRPDLGRLACAGRSVVVLPPDGYGQTIDWSLRWPSLSSHKGWRSLGVLRPGQRITLR